MSEFDDSLAVELRDLVEEKNYDTKTKEAAISHVKEVLSDYELSTEEKKSAEEAADIWNLIASDTAMEEYGSEMTERFWRKSFISKRSTGYGEGDRIEEIFYFATSGLLGEEIPQVRVLLRDVELPELDTDSWEERLRQGLMKATVLTIRKDGWKDIEEAVSIADKLRSEQEEYEEDFLEDSSRDSVKELLALYNLVKMVDLAAGYVAEGSPTDVLNKLDRFNDNVDRILGNSRNDVTLIQDMVYLSTKKMVEDSLWYQTRAFQSTNVKDYVNELTDEARDQPILDLMPSQQEAIQNVPISPNIRSVVLTMPTGTGKTMMAEFSIAQAKNLAEDSTVIYLAPTRALVNQTTLDLRRKLSSIGLTVESAVPAFELDPTEEEYLEEEDIDVLVSTPEKVELLLKEGHPAISDISLVVADEAHNVEEESRGANLELLLSTISREYQGVKFLLLSPFIPNADQLGEWLGDESYEKAEIQWRATDQVAGISRVDKERGGDEYINLDIIPTERNTEIKEEFSTRLDGTIVGDDPYKKSKKKTAASTALNLTSDDGTVLIMCSSKSNSVEMATKVLPYMDEINIDSQAELILDYTSEQLGEDHFLVEMLKKGVAVHHGGIPPEIQYLIERLAEDGKIDILTSTTTLAQGVNFPIKHIVLENNKLKTGPPDYWEDLSHNDFWNIAGRAGRAFQDHMGSVIFSAKRTPRAQDSSYDEYREYLESSADEVLSSLYQALEDLESLDRNLDLRFVENNEEFASFMRYILHTVNVSSYQDVQTDLEDVLRSSLAYHQLEEENPDLASDLIVLARRYLEKLGITAENEDYIDLIDKTGFTSLSVDHIRRQPEIMQADHDTWEQENLFSEDTNNLEMVINQLEKVPEVDLGRYTSGELDVGEIADVVKDWVKGASLEEIADKYFHGESREERMAKASKYVSNRLMGYISWGMSSLQKISSFHNEDIDLEEVGHVPAMVFYGVNSEEGAALRMAGVPRNLADGLGEYYNEEFDEQPSLVDVREWLKELDDEAWSDASSFEGIEGERAKKLWRILNGYE